MSVIAAPFTRTLSRKLLVPWWLFLVTGIGWMLVALIVLRFDYKSVNAIAILFGIVAIAAGVLEIGVSLSTWQPRAAAAAVSLARWSADTTGDGVSSITF